MFPQVASALAAMSMAQSPSPAPSLITIPAPHGRFESSAPLPSLPPVVLDTLGNNVGIAHMTAKQRNLQCRMLWIDATANIVRTNSEEKIAALVDRIKRAGFNTIVVDVKPIVGFTLHPSKIAPKLTEWRGNTMPANFDPLAIFVREGKKANLSVMISMNAFSEGHRDVKQGIGYDKPDWQTVIYEPKVTARASFPTRPTYPVHEAPNQMPPNEEVLGVFTDAARVPQRPPADSIAAILSSTGQVLAQVEGSAIRSLSLQVPANGSVAIGFGRAGRFLRSYAQPNDRLEFEGVPHFVKISERPTLQVPLMMNPNHPEVQDYALAVLREVVANYDIDGVLYDDRLRYSGINGDFSEVTRRQFETYVGSRVNWPEDVFRFTIQPNLSRGIIPGKFYDAWMTFRALTLRNWVARARQTVDLARPGTLFGVYAGSWYGEYPNFGSNYASHEFEAGFWFLTEHYQKTGYAALLDVLVTGCYYPTATIAEALAANTPMGTTIEAAGQLSNRTARDQAWTYAGIALSSFKDRPADLMKALQACVATTQGIMVFDLSHDIDPMWSVFEQAFATPMAPPHSMRGLLTDVRKRRDAYDKSGRKDPPVNIAAGASGTGM
ncbi:MAG TPA: family 10 glycosylhydrolase [Fimbriimonadaceae bacterium]|nr:family 10 glycosylhydrolase [Fimbriimonadaceae bacterium]